MAKARITIEEIVDQETRCLMDRGFPLFLNLTEIHASFGWSEKEIARIMATKTPLISGRYSLRDVIYAVHGV